MYIQSLQGSDDGINTSFYLNHCDLEVQNSYIYCKGAFKNIDRAKKVGSLSTISWFTICLDWRAQISHHILYLVHYVRTNFKTYTKVTYNWHWKMYADNKYRLFWKISPMFLYLVFQISANLVTSRLCNKSQSIQGSHKAGACSCHKEGNDILECLR